MDEIQLRAALRPASDCPPFEVLHTDLTRPEGDEARANAERHLGECLHCRTEMDLLGEFEKGGVRPDEAASVKWITDRLQQRSGRTPAPDPGMSWWRAWKLPRLAFGVAGFALLALVAVGISSEWRLRQTIARPVPEFRDELQRTRKIEILSKPGFFNWKSVPDAAKYDLTVRTVDGAALFHNSFTGTLLAFPTEVDALVKSGKLLEWEVIARDSAGTEIAESGLQQLRQATSPSQ